jgi:acyl-CoA thioester hydrolase
VVFCRRNFSLELGLHLFLRLERTHEGGRRASVKRITIAGPRAGQHVQALDFRVAMRDMDHANIYYSTYYEWMERVLGEFLAGVGHSVAEIFANGMAIPVVESRCSYLAPVALGELLRVRSWIVEMGRASFVMAHDFTRVRDGARVAYGEVTHVWVIRPAMTSVAAPEWFRALGPSAPAADGGGADGTAERSGTR